MMRKSTYLLILMAFLALFLVACGGGDDGDAADEPAEESAAAEDALVGDAAAGEPLFQSTCSACHGTDAKGMPNLGKDMTISEFIAGSSDAELLAFVKVGRSVSDPDNTTNVDMPPKGGNPVLSDQDLADIIAFIRTLEE
jgi:disulfide bond formation protein DsbB